jgi:ligand-binding sensor domain-containing protein
MSKNLLIISLIILLSICNGSIFSQVRQVELPKNQYAFTFQEDRQGKVWVGLSDGSLQGSLGYIQNYKFIQVSGNDTIPTGSFHESIKLLDGSIMFGGNILSAKGKPLLVWVTASRADTIQIPFSLNNSFVNCISLINRREIWLGTASGILVNNRGKWSWYTVRNGLPDNFINAIYQDFRGIVWIGTELGVASFSDNQFKKVEAGSRIISSVTQFYGDKKGYVWCGSRFSSEGVSVYNGRLWETFSGRHGMVDNSSSVFFEDTNGVLWVGSCYHRSRGGVSSYDGTKWISYSSGKELAKPCVDAIIADQKGRIWFGGSLSPRKGNGITVFDGENWHYLTEKTGMPAERVIAFFCDNSGQIWISSFEGLFVVPANFVLM